MIFMNFNPEGGVASNSTVHFIGKELIFGLIIACFVYGMILINEKENEAKSNDYR